MKGKSNNKKDRLLEKFTGFEQFLSPDLRQDERHADNTGKPDDYVDTQHHPYDQLRNSLKKLFGPGYPEVFD